MQMSDSKNVTQAFFDKYRNKPLEFIIVTDINMKEHPNYYKAIFRDIKSNKVHTHLITPEMMSYKYKPGHIYVNGERIGKNKSLMSGEFTVNTNSNIPLKRISSVINEDDAELISYEGVKKFFLRQYTHIEVQDECTLIVPCYTIANRFYFLTSSLKQSVMNGSLDDLYYDGSFRPVKKSNGNICIEIHIKKKAGTTYLPQICRFIGYKFSRSRFLYIATQKALMPNKYEFYPIKAQFPVEYAFKINATYIYVGDDERGKPKYLVLNISSDNIGFAFQEIDYKLYKEGEDPKTIDPEIVPVPENPLYKPPKKNPKRNNKIYEGTPLNDYLQYTLGLAEDEDHFDNRKIDINGQAIYLGGGKDPINENIDKSVGNSFEEAASNGDDNLAPIVYGDAPENTKKKKEIFNLENFYQFYEALLTFAGVYGEELEGPREIQKIQNAKRDTIKSKSILYGDENKSRRFLFGEFLYGKKQAYIVEIEQDDSWGPSTWIFIDHGSESLYTSDEMKELIEHYIEEDMTYVEFFFYVFKNKKLIFNRKTHKKGKVDDINIEQWCKGVLKKVLDPKIMKKKSNKIEDATND